MPVATPFADAALAARLEAVSAHENERFAAAALRLDPASTAASAWIAGGCAVYLGPGAVLNQATGLGLDGPVTAEDVDELEAFFNTRGARAKVNVCPLAHPTLAGELSRRGYRVDDFENVLVMALEPATAPPAPDPAIDIREAGPELWELWGRQVARGFSAPGDATEADLALGHLIAHQEGIARFLAYVDGEPAGTGELAIRDGLGWLSADTTLPAYRGRGIQSAMQRARLTRAWEAGCDLAVTESHPGSGSQRNMERLGFRVAYTRVDMVQREV